VYLLLAGTALGLGCREATIDPNGPGAATAREAAAARSFAGRCEVTVTETALSNDRVRLTGQGTCELTHLGRSAYAVEQIADPVQGVLTGTATFTAANGDELRATLTGPFAAGASLDAFQSTVTFTGGTGRFLAATGSANFTRGTGLVDTYTGFINYDASGKTPGGAVGIALEIRPGAVLLPGTGAQQQLTVYSVDAAGQRTAVSATFQSSDPEVVSVSSGGLATALTALGSSHVIAQANGLTSAPVLVVVAQPAAGALLVSDDQVVGTPVPLVPDAPYRPGYQYRVQLRLADPAVGQVVLGTGASPVGGRVVSVTDAGPGLKDVVLELLPLSGMFTALSINQRIPLAQAQSTVPAGIAADFIVETRPDGSQRYRPRGPGRLEATNLVPALALNEFEFELGRFTCKVKVEGALSFPLILDAFSVDLNPNLTLDLVVADVQVQRLVVQGQIAPRISSDLLLNAAVKGSAGCKVELRTLILPIGGPISLLIGGQVPLGVGFDLEAKVEVAGIGYDAFFESSVAASFGVDCAAGCQVVQSLSSTAGGFFKPRLPATFNDLRTELAVNLFGYAELQLGNPFVNELQFKTVEIKAGLQQKAQLASELGQATDPGYASSFSLAPTLEAKTTSDVSALAGLLNIQLAELSFAPSLPSLATSPAGTFTITPASVQAGSATEVGEPATFTVTLNPVTYLGLDAVESVEIRRLVDDGTGTLVLELGRPGCTSLVAVSGQTVFTCQTDFLEADEGPQQFVAFVKAKLFGISVPLLLEVAENAVATVDVVVEDPLTIDTGTLPDGTVGVSYSQALQASGGSGTLQWSVTSGQLPPGLSLASSGAITGTPTTPGAFTFTVTVVSGTQSTQRALVVTIGTATAAPIEGVYVGTAAMTGLDIPQGFTRTDRWFVTESGPGTGLYFLQLGSRQAAALFLVPAGTFTVTGFFASMTATGSLANGRLQLAIDAPGCGLLFTGAIFPCTYTFDGLLGPSITTVSLPDGSVGSDYSAALEATGGVGNFQWSLSAGQLPPGLSLAASGTITGVPTTAGNFSFTVKVISGIGDAERGFLIAVGQQAPITGAYDGTETVTCCAPSFTTTVFSAPGRWWLLQGTLFTLIRGLLSDPTTPPLQTFVPGFFPATDGIFGAAVNGIPVLSGTVSNGQLQFVWDGLCNVMPPFNGSFGTCRLTFNGTRNPSP
jgi:hypothetical protein